MIHENNSSDFVDPDDMLRVDGNEKGKGNLVKDEDENEGYDILPSNGPGLTGDDGEQVIDSGDTDDEDEDEKDS